MGLDVHMVNTLKMNIVFIMQDFGGVGFGWCLGLRCSSLSDGWTSLWILEQMSTNNVPLLIHVQTFYVFVHLHRMNVKMASGGMGFKPSNVAMARASSMYVSTPGDTLFNEACSHAHVILNSMPSFFCFWEDGNMITHANSLSRNNMFIYGTQI